MTLAHRLAIGAAAALLVIEVAHIAQGPARPNPAVTPGATMSVTVPALCRPGYTASVRQSLTVSELRQVDRAYHWTYRAGAQEYDHLISLELGGANGIKNIWPEPIDQARQKDLLENRLHALVCAGRLPLRTAQTCIAADWVACARKHP